MIAALTKTKIKGKRQRFSPCKVLEPWPDWSPDTGLASSFPPLLPSGMPFRDIALRITPCIAQCYRQYITSFKGSQYISEGDLGMVWIGLEGFAEVDIVRGKHNTLYIS
jgi:hypothetical protein